MRPHPSSRLLPDKILPLRDHAEIARKYCRILNKFGPHSVEVRRAVLTMSAGAGEPEVLHVLESILQTGPERVS